MHITRLIFFLSIILFISGFLFPTTNLHAAFVFLDAAPSSGVDDGINGFTVKLTCTVPAYTSTPKSYIFDFGDGSEEVTVNTSAYSHTITHDYRAGIYDASCKVYKVTGSLNESDPVAIVVAKWRFETGADVESSPAIGPDGTIYVGSDDGNLYAIDPETGSEKWRFSTGAEILSTPAVDPEGTIYFGSLDKQVYALKPSGELKWSFQTGGEIFSSPAIWPEGRILYIGTNDGSLYALNTTGTFRWKFTTGDKIISAPSIGHDGIEHVVYFGSMDRYIYALAAGGTSPKLKWKFRANAGIYASPAIGSDGRVYIGELQLENVEEYRYKFYCLNPDGTKYWSYTERTGFYSSPAIGPDGEVYVGSREGRFFSLEPDGEVDWMIRPGPPFLGIDSSPAIGSNSRVYVGNRAGMLHALEAYERGNPDWSFDTGDSILYSSPVIDANGVIYIGSQDNNVYAIAPLNHAQAQSAWPMFRGNAARTGMAAAIEIPDIMSTDPMMNSTGIQRDITQFRIHFSPEMDINNIDIDSLRLEKVMEDGNETVDGYAFLDYTRYNNVAYRPTAVFTRIDNSDLPYNTTYTASISYSKTEDEAVPAEGTTPTDFSFSFTTKGKPEVDPDPDPGPDFGCFINCLSK